MTSVEVEPQKDNVVAIRARLPKSVAYHRRDYFLETRLAKVTGLLSVTAPRTS
ncbi:hypothetical protein HZC09_00030 [Candidatus Micrarchaeota archaeon]|nr:hypothetical protein [Candidatus Micrarchaeota archaeon]